jgi:hypothetical protein
MSDLKRLLQEFRYDPDRRKRRVKTTATIPPPPKFTRRLKDEEKIVWSHNLRSIWKMIQAGKHICVSGKAGTGKSHLLRSICDFLSDHTSLNVTVVAPTAIAAINAAGTTIHSWMGMGLLKDDLPTVFKNLYRFKRGMNNISFTDVLLIDEVSMVQPSFFIKIAAICARVYNSQKPFGDIQVIFFGDFLQLPPITNESDREKYVFQTSVWKSMKIHRILLRHVYRQSDPVFLKALNSVRLGNITSFVENTLGPRFQTPQGAFTRLCSYNAVADAFNTKKLASITTQADIVCVGLLRFEAKDKMKRMSDNDVRQGRSIVASQDITKRFSVPMKLVLKVGAQVMCRVNTYMPRYGICNGSMGEVVHIQEEEYVHVQFKGGLLLKVERFEFKNNIGKTATLVFSQFPLTLSWAISIHKCQGMTLERAFVDSRTFLPGQFYVAISRVKTLKGLFIEGDKQNLKRIQVNKHATKFEEDEVLLLLQVSARYCKTSPWGRAFQHNPTAEPKLIQTILSFLH